MIIGITGSIATGKSTVANYLIKKGYTVIDSDEIVHDLYNDDIVIKGIVDNFGTNLLINGLIDRKRLGQIIFSNEDKRRVLNNLIHPLVIEKIKKSIEANKDKLLIFVDIPLLFEEKLEYLVDKTVVIYLKKDIQIKRLMLRDKIDEQYAIKKITASMDLEIKKTKADYVIDNSYDLSTTYKEIDKILRRIENEI